VSNASIVIWVVVGILYTKGFIDDSIELSRETFRIVLGALGHILIFAMLIYLTIMV